MPGGSKGSVQLLGESTTLQLLTEEVQMVLTRGERGSAAEMLESDSDRTLP
jgi:hypothetical protein